MVTVPLASNGLSPDQISAAVEVLNSGNLTMGSRVAEFEKRMAEYLGRKHFVMVNSGSSANLAMIEACLRPTNGRPYLCAGDEVIVPAIAWPTTVWPLVQLGLQPVFVDIDTFNLGLNLDLVEEEILRRKGSIRAIFVIHPLGVGVDESRLVQIQKKYGVLILNDNCESLGSKTNQTHTASSGLASSYSFYFSHHITTMEGGGIATDDDSFADDLRSIRSHGWSRDRTDNKDWANMAEVESPKFLFVGTGFNIRPMEIQAAIGLSQVGLIDKYVDKRREIADLVSKACDPKKLRLIGARVSDEVFRASWMLLPIQVLGEDVKKEKDEVILRLSQYGIESRPVLTGNFLRQPAIRRLFPHLPDASRFPGADQIESSAFLIGCHHEFSDEQIRHLCDAIASI